MNPFQLGLRNLLGVIIPGALLTLVLAYCVLTIGNPIGWPRIAGQMLKEQGALVSVGLFLISYVLGSLIRLYAADRVDNISARLNSRKHGTFPGPYPELIEPEKQLHEMFNTVVSGSEGDGWSKDLITWVWENDRFPYPVWQFMKFKLYHPQEMFRFFTYYRNCFGTGSRRAKEFFNYCKMVIYSTSRQKGDGLAEEVQAAEGNTRFFAGTFYALSGSSIALLCCGAFQFFQPANSRYHTIATFVVAGVTLFLSWLVVAGGRFRLVRLKEVDAVFDAFYLEHRHPDECGLCAEPFVKEQSREYVEREKLIRDAFSKGNDGKLGYGPIELQRLLLLMKERSLTDKFLSSIYFAGAIGDHPYFVINDRLAVGISVLPEDVEKSSVSKKHPHQQEVIFVLEGRIYLEVDMAGKQLLKTGEVAMIHPGQCHRVTDVEQEHASYLFVKTDPAKEPRHELCQLERQK